MIAASRPEIAHPSPRDAQHNAPRVNPVAVTLLAIGSATVVAGLLVGAVAFIPASNALDAMCPQRMCTATQETRALFERTERLGWSADLVVAIGALYLVAGGAWLAAERVDRGVRRVRVSVGASADGVAIVAAGRF